MLSFKNHGSLNVVYMQLLNVTERRKNDKVIVPSSNVLSRMLQYKQQIQLNLTITAVAQLYI